MCMFKSVSSFSTMDETIGGFKYYFLDSFREFGDAASVTLELLKADEPPMSAWYSSSSKSFCISLTISLNAVLILILSFSEG